MKILIIALALAANVTAQPIVNRPMLGDIEPGGSVRTPVYGIKVWPQGFDRVRRNAIRGTVTWMNANGFSGFVPEFSQIGNEADAMLAHIDQAYAATLAKWTACGGVYSVAALLNARNLVVIIEAAPFTDPFYGPNVTLSGIVNGNQVRIVIAHIHSSLAFMQHYKNLSEWEFGNWFQCQLFGCAASAGQEIGNSSPCGQ